MLLIYIINNINLQSFAPPLMSANTQVFQIQQAYD